MKPWYVYMVRCKDNSLYTGITNDLTARITKHNSRNGAKYTRSRQPVVLVWSKKMKSESDARKQEALIKKLTKNEKEKLIK
ncbi:MAG: GIY-YIG nuclease family protein [Patescibacteria group bacterium]